VPAREISTHVSLLAKLRNADDPSAYAEFDGRYRELAYLFARRTGLQAADADDVVQDVLAAVRSALRNFDYDPAKGRFRSWLKTAVLRAVHRRRRPAADALLRAADDEQALAALCSDPELERVWESEWRRYHLRTAAARARFEFNARDYAAFEAVTVEGRSPAEVAAALGISADAVYQAKSRLLKRIRELVAEQVAEEG
jgi:RNA polymerase sigma-70 factor (ECF subfamily)